MNKYIRKITVIEFKLERIAGMIDLDNDKGYSISSPSKVGSFVNRCFDLMCVLKDFETNMGDNKMTFTILDFEKNNLEHLIKTLIDIAYNFNTYYYEKNDREISVCLGLLATRICAVLNDIIVERQLLSTVYKNIFVDDQENKRGKL